MGSNLIVQNTDSNDSSEDSKSLTEYDWALEYINEFIDSPVWRDPVQSYIDENCIVFDGEEEMTHVQNMIYRRFNRIIEELIERYIHSIGLSTQQFLTSLTGGGKKRLTKQILEFILCYDDFIAFKNMMRTRNLELEQEALRMIQQGLTPRMPKNSVTASSTTVDARPPNNATKGGTQHDSHRKNSGNAEAEMLEHAIKDSLRRDEEEDLQRAIEISMQTLNVETGIWAGERGNIIPKSARTKGNNVHFMTENLKLIRPLSLPIAVQEIPSTDSGLYDEWPSTHSSSFSSKSGRTSLEAIKSNRKTFGTPSSSATKDNENSSVDTSSIELNHGDIEAFSEKKDPSQELASKQDFQRKSSVEVENRKNLIKKHKNIIMRENRRKREKKRREYDKSKLISAVEFLRGPSDGGKSLSDEESEKKLVEMKKWLTNSIKSDLSSSSK